MKAIWRWGAGLCWLLLVGSVSEGYHWVSPVYKMPYPTAPSTYNSGFYLVDAWGRLTGPHYYLAPPFPPFRGQLPGPIGAAIQSGNLPHTLLNSKHAMTLGDAPLLSHKRSPGQPVAPAPPAPLVAQGTHVPHPGMAGPYPTVGGADMQRFGNMQVPYGGMPTTPWPMANPYAPPMPYPMPYGAMPPPMPYGAMPNPYARPMLPAQPMPYAAPMEMYPAANPAANIWQVQNMAPHARPSPFMPIPGYARGGPLPNMPAMQGMMPAMPMMPTMPMRPMMPAAPGMTNGPGDGFHFYGPMQPFAPMGPLQGPQPPQMNMAPLQAPRMDLMPPPQTSVGGGAYPTHPFTRSPRDFFMWGENLDDERERGRRP